MREEIGDVMNKLKKTAALVAVVGGLGLAGSGVASANDGPFPVPVDNLQVVKCEQSFASESLFTSVPAAGGDLEQNIGNFCAAAHVED
ncbi:hypothetical protein [Streptomyces sp. DSM 40750]|uniref:hypothetical protein n=1 Tax=Streptomyces sp. DSM 40750 TaxID=2801030 RepID=UPI00214A8B73|nr:hypothetical protein [Streptomyces sp. DSM 40750]UUU22208.1 hypothetical protein JIX55_18885 [Streptomyces sp. DSM 40750]